MWFIWKRRGAPDGSPDIRFSASSKEEAEKKIRGEFKIFLGPGTLVLEEGDIPPVGEFIGE